MVGLLLFYERIDLDKNKKNCLDTDHKSFVKQFSFTCFSIFYLKKKGHVRIYHKKNL